MVNQLKQIASEIIDEKGNLGLLAQLYIESMSDASVIVMSADWVHKEEDQNQSFHYLLNKLKQNLDANQLAQITRIGVFANDNHLIKLLSKYKTDAILNEEQVNGFSVKKGYIIYSSLPISQ